AAPPPPPPHPRRLLLALFLNGAPSGGVCQVETTAQLTQSPRRAAMKFLGVFAAKSRLASLAREGTARAFGCHVAMLHTWPCCGDRLLAAFLFAALVLLVFL